MNLQTACPHCLTVFRLNAELLTAREGQVRCGVCNGIFDAREHLTPETDSIVETAHASEQTIETPSPPASTPGAVVEEESVQSDPVSPIVVVEVAPFKEEFAPLRESAKEPGEETPSLDTDKPETVRPAPKPTPSTVNVAPRSRTHRHLFISAVSSALLGILLIAQLIYLARTPLAARVPAIKPWLVAACAPLGCSVPLPRDPDAITISSSDLLSDPAYPARIQVNLLIANEADYAQAYPHIELTLTDSVDIPLARRVFSPVEYLDSPEKRAQGISPRSEASVDLQLEIGDLPASGYRLLVFYP